MKGGIACDSNPEDLEAPAGACTALSPPAGASPRGGWRTYGKGHAGFKNTSFSGGVLKREPELCRARQWVKKFHRGLEGYEGQPRNQGGRNHKPWHTTINRHRQGHRDAVALFCKKKVVLASLSSDAEGGRRRGFETTEDCGDLAAVLDDHGMGHSEFPADFSRPHSLEEIIQDGPFDGKQVGIEQGNNIPRAHPAEERVTVVNVVEQGLFIVFVRWHFELTGFAFGGINAAPGDKVVQQMEFAALEVPAPGLTGAVVFG